MKPILLKIEGLNSFENEQIIDFSVLTKQGLFGIFGCTGSGKSTIIDAITMSLYGEISRFDKKKGNQFINVNSKFARLYFKFLLATEVYVVERAYKKTEQSSEQTLARLIKIENNEEKIIVDSITTVNESIKTLISLDYKDFSRSVVLPQGKFSDFLTIENKDRNNMLERIFNLEKYGQILYTKLKNRLDLVTLNSKILNDKIVALGTLTEVDIENFKKTFSLEKKELELLKIKQEKNINELNLYENIKLDYDEFLKYSEKHYLLKSKADEIKNKEEKIKANKKTKEIIPLIKEQKETLDKISEIENLLLETDTLLKTKEIDFNNYSKEFENSKELKDNKYPLLIKNEENLIRIIKTFEKTDFLEKEINQLLEEHNLLKKENLAFENEEKKLSNNINLSKENLNFILTEKQDLYITPETHENILKAFENSKNILFLQEKYNTSNEKFKKEKNLFESDFNKKEIFEEEFALIQERLKKITEEKAVKPCEEKELFELKYKILEEEKELEKQKLELLEKEKLKEKLNEQEFTLKTLEELFEKEFSDKTLLKNSIYFLKNNLKNNEPCPICGALEHSENNLTLLTEHLEKIKSTKQLKNKYLVSLKESYEKLSKEFENYKTTELYKEKDFKIFEKKLNNLNISKATIYEKLESSKKIILFLEEDLNLIKKNLEQSKEAELNYKEILKTENIILLYNSIVEKDKKRLSIEKQEVEFRKGISNSEKAIEILRVKVLEVIKKIQEITTIGSEKRKQLDSLFKEIADKPSNPNEILIQITTEIELITTQYNILEKQYTEIKEELLKLNNKKENLKIKKEFLGEILIKQNKILENKLLELEVKDVNLALTEEEEKLFSIEVESYKNELKSLEINIIRLEDKLKNKDLSNLESKINDLKTESLVLKESIETAIETLTKYKSELDNMEKNIDFLVKYSKEKSLIEHKKSLLSDLATLLEGKKFVNYMAKRHLSNITLEASLKLKEMSSGRYAIELDNSDFVIRDDFNGGIRRSPKTLSGGETFITSLCLALSLSMNIQLKSKFPLEFFFLDEGFGTLDPLLLDTVIEALEKLGNKKMSVGIISHVEEVRNRIPLKLMILPAEQGVCGTKVFIDK